jgi:hypothetical protein
MKKVSVEYHLVNGTVVRKYKFLEPHGPSLWKGKIWFPGLEEGDFICQREESPEGMFVIEEFDESERKFVLREVNCDPIHWKGDENGRGHGPDEDCERKKCPYYNECPISVHLMKLYDVE